MKDQSNVYFKGKETVYWNMRENVYLIIIISHWIKLGKCMASQTWSKNTRPL